MKIRNLAKRRESGSVLVVTMLTAGIIGFALASYLTLASNQNRSTVRSQTWNASIPVVEAGIEEALTHLNNNSVANISRDGWTLAALNTYRMQRTIGDSYYIVDIDITSPTRPIIHSQGFVPAPLVSASPETFVAQAGGVNQSVSGGVSYVSRKVKVTTTLDPLISKAMVAKGQIDMNGNGVQTDSFDSIDPSYSTNGQYDSNKHKDHGDVATISGLINSLNVGQANIFGKVSTGPGGSVAIGSQGLVGNNQFQTDSAYRNSHDANNDGIQDSFFADDMNVNFPDVKVPFSGGYFTPSGGSVTQQVVTVTATTNTSGSYPGGSGVQTNTTATTTAAFPGAGTYVGSVTTNWAPVTTASYPSSSTFRTPVTTNTTTTSSSAYPGSSFGPVTTNTTFTTSDLPPVPGTYLGSVVIRHQGSHTYYDYNRITGYTYQTITGYTATDITGYTYGRISGYTSVAYSYSTNTTVTTYDYILRDGDYQLSTLSGTVYVAGNARLYVPGSTSLSGITIAQSGASLRLYTGGTSVSLGGNGVVNNSGNANNFYLYGLPSVTSISVSGNGGFTGVIYAPNADYTLNGGGNNTQDFIGASVTKTVRMNGHFHFHYDENLARVGPARGYIVTSWNEE